METTLNIHRDTLNEIDGASELHGISWSAVIALLLQKVMREKINTVSTGRPVRYQKRCRKEEWRKIHVKVRGDEYEYFHDLRKILKMSVSLILAYAVKKYIRNLIEEDITDNYRNQYRNYVIIEEFIDNIPCWKLIWGFPPHIEQHIKH